jgi:hypothetical protein
MDAFSSSFTQIFSSSLKLVAFTLLSYVSGPSWHYSQGRRKEANKGQLILLPPPEMPRAIFVVLFLRRMRMRKSLIIKFRVLTGATSEDNE